MIGYDLNPFDLILRVVNNLYPHKSARISFLSEESFKGALKKIGAKPEEIKSAWGVTFFDDDGSDPVVFINAEIPCHASVEIIAHEVAHVVAGVSAGHGEIWEAEFDKIFNAYCDEHENMSSLL